MKALIIGGNRFFGKKLAKLLIGKNYEVTLLNRGKTDDGLGDSVSRLVCDRTDTNALKEVLKDQSWDLVFDQVCYDYKTAKEACEVFNGRVKKYIFTSTKSVYAPKADLTEKDFDPITHEMTDKVGMNQDYGEAKRQAEMAFHKYADFPLVAVRFPIVIGEDDYTRRFAFHVSRIAKGEEIFFPNLDARISFVSSDDAAKALLHLSESSFTGAVNVASPSSIRLSDFIKLIENAADQKTVLAESATDDNHSPYGISEDWFADCSLLHSTGLKLPELNDWLPLQIQQELEQIERT